MAKKLIMSDYNKANIDDNIDSVIMANKQFVDKASSRLGFLEYLSEAVLVVDNDRTVYAVNSAAERLLGWSTSELIGKHCRDIFGCQHPDNTAPLCENLCPLLLLYSNSEQGYNNSYQEISIRTKTSQRREVSVSFAPLEIPLLLPLVVASSSSVPVYNIIVLRDVSEQKRQERIKTQFIATASHQLRTPLASIKTAIGLLVDNVGTSFSPPLLRLLQNIQSSSLRMERLVNDLIELSNLQSGRVQMQRLRVEARQLVAMVVKLSQERLTARQQSLSLELPTEDLFVTVDVSRISQVLSHLISNASKFSAAGSNIKLSVTAVQVPDADVIFSVRDEGIGIAEDEQGLIFEKFYQSLVTENSAEIGNGLGLPLAKALIELNNGRLWFDSKLGMGSTFYFALPAT